MSLLAFLMSNTGSPLAGAKLMLADNSFAGSSLPRQQPLPIGIEAALPSLQGAGHARSWHQVCLCAVSGHPKQMMQVSPSLDPFSWCSATHLSSPQGLQEFLGVACIDAPKPVAIAGVHGAKDQHIASILQPQGSELRSL